jgi:hypothetical protein
MRKIKHIFAVGPGRRLIRVPVVQHYPDDKYPTRSEMLGAMIASRTPAQIWSMAYNSAVKRSPLMLPSDTSKWAEQQADKLEAEIDDLIASKEG